MTQGVSSMAHHLRSTSGLDVKYSADKNSVSFLLDLLIQYSGTPYVRCPSNGTDGTKITFIYTLFPLEYENLAGVEEAETLDDMKGFGANLFKDFLAKCPMAYTLKKTPGFCAEHFLNNNRSMCINMYAPNSNNYSHTTNPVIIFPSALVYFSPSVPPNIPPMLLYRYGITTIAVSILGSILLIAIVRIEKIQPTERKYGEVIWNLFLSPFGLCSSLMESTSIQVFTMFWLLGWFLTAGLFWAEMSSSLTVNKIYHDINSFQDVLDSKRIFFWLPEMQVTPQKVVQDLNLRFEKYGYESYSLDGGNRADYFNLKDTTKNLLERKSILLAWGIDLKMLLSNQLISNTELVVKYDWSVPHTFNYFLPKMENNLLDSVNEFLSNRQESGVMEKEYKKWYEVDRANNHKSQDISFELGPLLMVMYTVILGSVLTLIVSLCDALYKRKQCANKVKQLENANLSN